MDYKKILKGIVDIINTAEKSDIGFANICTYIGENCPELKESKDEKIRKEMLQIAKESEDSFYMVLTPNKRETLIAWLEKQGEQTLWSEEDEDILNTIINHFEIDLECTENDDIIKWLKSLKNRYTWKPSDKQMKLIEHICDGNYKVDLDILDSIYRDFKKLRGE